jgi:Helix-turn-helix domain
MIWKKLLAEHKVHTHSTSKKELAALRAVITRDLSDAAVKGLSEDRRFATAYNAALQAAKVQEVMLQAMAKKISWWQAAEILGVSDRHMRRWRERYEEFGFRGLFDRRRGKPSPKRVAVATVERGSQQDACFTEAQPWQ